jgi:hypothetical protein
MFVEGKFDRYREKAKIAGEEATMNEKYGQFNASIAVTFKEEN